MSQQPTVEACPHCGTVLDTHVSRQLYDEAVQALEQAERDLRAKRAKISRLEADQIKQPSADAMFDDAMEVLLFWREHCSPTARELNGKRLEKTLARLHGGYDKFELMRAVFGYSRKPYIVLGRRCERGLRQQWHADADLIFRDAKHVDAGIAISADYEDQMRDTPLAPAQQMLESLPDQLF